LQNATDSVQPIITMKPKKYFFQQQLEMKSKLMR